MLWRTVALISLTLAAAAGWSACDRVSSALDTGPMLTPEELPLHGETVLPHIGQSPPDIRITPRGDNRGKSGTMALSEAC